MKTTNQAISPMTGRRLHLHIHVPLILVSLIVHGLIAISAPASGRQRRQWFLFWVFGWPNAKFFVCVCDVVFGDFVVFVRTLVLGGSVAFDRALVFANAKHQIWLLVKLWQIRTGPGGRGRCKLSGATAGLRQGWATKIPGPPTKAAHIECTTAARWHAINIIFG